MPMESNVPVEGVPSELMAGPDVMARDESNTLDANIVNVLRGIADLETYPPDTTLVHQGEREQTFYVVEQGSVVVLRRTEDGEERLLSTLGPRQSFGEMALVDDSPRLATVRTVTETTVLEITADRFRALLHTDPDLAFHIARRILSNLRKLDQLAIFDLRAKNELLQQAYLELQAAQLVLIEKKRLEREMELAAEMQRNLLPDVLPNYPDYRFSSYLAPADRKSVV